MSRRSAGRSRTGTHGHGHGGSLSLVSEATAGANGAPRRHVDHGARPISSHRIANTHRGKRHWLDRDRLHFYHWRDVPRYLQDNPFIHTSYRSGYTYAENWISLFHLHNEWCNIWTHVIGCVAMVALAASVAMGPGLEPFEDRATGLDRFVISLQVLCSAYTFGASALYHLHMSHSHEACVWFGCLDYSGISANVFGSALSVIYFLFYCDRATTVSWLIPIVIVNTLGILGPSIPDWATGKFRPVRTALYLSSAAISLLLPVSYYLYVVDKRLPFGLAGCGAGWFVLGLALLLGGTGIYVGKIPERLFPGRFDIFFHSHNFWHILCVVAAWTHYRASYHLLQWRLEDGVCPV